MKEEPKSVQTVFRDLKEALEEIDRLIENPPVSPNSYIKELHNLKSLKTACVILTNDLLNASENQKIALSQNFAKTFQKCDQMFKSFKRRNSL